MYTLGRENLDVTPSEIPLVPNDQHVYKDENITVYAFPVSPLHETSEDNTPELDRHPSVLKRKRRVSPEIRDRPTKRGTGATAVSDSPLSIQELMARSDFDPTSLSEEMAQAWRRHVVKLMFPATQVPQENGGQSSKGKQKGVDRAGQPSADEPPNTAHVCQPPGLRRPLPFPERSLVGSPETWLRPTVAYAIHGPRVRGKFDVQKAEALGLKHGPLRAVLTRGQPVTIKVDDGRGNVVDREIKPADCIAEGSLPGVSVHSISLRKQLRTRLVGRVTT